MNHYEMAKLCQDSYKYATFSVSECEVLLKYIDGDCFVVCRGTELPKVFPKKHFWENFRNIWDLVRDASLLPSHDKDLGWCHSGFLDGGIQVAEFIAKHADKKQPLYFAGHSLGGALALVCAAKLSAKGFKVREWVGFASPKLSFISDPVLRFQKVNYRFKNDVVPLMPRIRGYRHNYPVIRLLSDRFTKGPATLDDHDIGLYINALRRNQAEG